MTDARVAPTFPGSAPLFDKRAFGRYRIPRLLGEAVSGMDDPAIVAAASADHMRTDDYVIGLVFRGRARAYPLWIVDNYHVVNDRVAGERILVASCERCQSGSAFVPDVPGDPEREPLFRSVGFLNATLVLKDLRSASHWLHYDGLGLDRRAAGRRLPWIPTYHMEWGDWLALHPDSEVMVPPDDVTHPDARHGHGREEIFARPGHGSRVPLHDRRRARPDLPRERDGAGDRRARRVARLPAPRSAARRRRGAACRRGTNGRSCSRDPGRAGSRWQRTSRRYRVER